MSVLAVNAGSSTLKFALYPVAQMQAGVARLSGSIDGLSGTGPLSMSWRSDGQAQQKKIAVVAGERFGQALQVLQQLLREAASGLDLQAIAHRIVHGGEHYRQPVRVSDADLAALEQLAPLAPLHQPHNLAGVRAFMRAYPALPQVACFDTAFHASLPDVEYAFALPGELRDAGVRRYGFHGLSYQYLMQTLPRHSARAGGRVLMAHLGSGASLCAAQDGRSHATTMGFSALDGLMMGTRSGALDPGVLLHLLAQGWTPERLQALLYRQSGLLGVSGLSGDMRVLRRSQDPLADLAIRMFTYRVVREAGAMVACIGGLDLLAFTGGIGEHDVVLREQVCAQLAFLGLALDGAANAACDGTRPQALHASGSAVEIWMVPTDEGRVAAQAAAALLAL